MELSALGSPTAPIAHPGNSLGMSGNSRSPRAPPEFPPGCRQIPFSGGSRGSQCDKSQNSKIFQVGERPEIPSDSKGSDNSHRKSRFSLDSPSLATGIFGEGQTWAAPAGKTPLFFWEKYPRFLGKDDKTGAWAGGFGIPARNSGIFLGSHPDFPPRRELRRRRSPTRR